MGAALVTCIIIIVVALVCIKILGIFAAQIDGRLAQALTYVIAGVALIGLIKVLFPLLSGGHLL